MAAVHFNTIIPCEHTRFEDFKTFLYFLGALLRVSYTKNYMEMSSRHLSSLRFGLYVAGRKFIEIA